MWELQGFCGCVCHDLTPSSEACGGTHSWPRVYVAGFIMLAAPVHVNDLLKSCSCHSRGTCLFKWNYLSRKELLELFYLYVHVCMNVCQQTLSLSLCVQTVPCPASSLISFKLLHNVWVLACKTNFSASPCPPYPSTFSSSPGSLLAFLPPPLSHTPVCCVESK